MIPNIRDISQDQHNTHTHENRNRSSPIAVDVVKQMEAAEARVKTGRDILACWGTKWAWMALEALRVRVACTRTETARPPNGRLDANASYWHTVVLVQWSHNVDIRKERNEWGAVGGKSEGYEDKWCIVVCVWCTIFKSRFLFLKYEVPRGMSSFLLILTITEDRGGKIRVVIEENA